VIYFAFTLVQLFQKGTVQRLLFGKETFQFIDIVRKCCSYRVYYQAHSASTRIKRPTT
jgi:hypothetical protein